MPIDTTRRPEMRWVPVADQSGRARMEAVWLSPDQVAAPTARVNARPAAAAPAPAPVAAPVAAAVTHAA